jgi:hypothetical protein
MAPAIREESDMRRVTGFFAAIPLVLAAGSAGALTLGFDCVSGNVAGDCTIGEAQLAVEINAGPGVDQVSFRFTNSGLAASSITDVYFDDGTLLDIASIVSGAGVAFAEGASPGNLPAGNTASPPFVATFSADSNNPVSSNGVNPGEELTIVFDLQGGLTLADVEAAIADGSLRVGIHVQSFATGGSEAFVNVPEPGVALLLAGLLGLALWGCPRGAC